MNMKSILTLSVGVMLTLPLVAENEVYEGYWESTGNGVKAYWWNPESWRDGIVPGRYIGKDADGNLYTNGNYGATAYLGSKSWDYLNPEVFDAGWDQCKLISISNVVCFADKFPQTSIGQSQWHHLYLERGGGIYVLDTCTKAPTFNCSVCFDEITDSTPLTFQNDASGSVMTFKWGFGRRARAVNYSIPPMRYGGKGSISLAGGQPSADNCRFYTDLFFTYPGKLILTGTFQNTLAVRTLEGYGRQTVEVGPGAYCLVDTGGQYAQQIVATTDLDFIGEGTLVHKKVGSDPWDMRMKVGAGCTLNIACAFSNDWPTTGFAIDGEAGGVVKITGDNQFNGPVTIQNGAIFEAQALGLAGAESPLGRGDTVKLLYGGTIRYTGAGDTTDRTIAFGYPNGVLDQAGTGRPVFAGPLMVNANSKVILTNGTSVAAEISGQLDAGEAAPKIEKYGSGEWVLSGMTPAVGDTTVRDGTLTISHPEGLTASKLTVAKGGTLALGGAEAPESRPDALTVYGAGKVKASWPMALPVAGVTLPNGASLSVVLPNWTWAEVLSYANAHPQSGWAAIAVDTSALADGTEFELANADVTATEGFALGHTGDNAMNLKVTDAVANPVALVVSEGTMRVSGDGSLALSKALATSPGSGSCGKLVFDGLKGGVTLASGNLMIGSASVDAPGGCGEVVVEGTSVADDETAAGKAYVGAYGQGLLKIGEGANWSVKNVSVGTGDANNTASGEGAIWQTAGLFDASSGLNLGSHGVGLYLISGGRMIAGQGNGTLGGYEGQGILVQSGGEIETPAGQYVTLGNYGGLVAYQTGGTCTFGSRTYLTGSGAGFAKFSSSYTVAGKDAVTAIDNETLYLGNGQRDGADGPLKAVLNLNGGVFHAQAVGRYPYTDIATTDARKSRSYVNFSGGTLDATSPSAVGSRYGYPTVPNRVTVFAGGATVCVSNNDSTIWAPLLAPFGNSVVSVPVPAEIADRDFVASPYVEIFDVEGEGDGATAYAEVDQSTRRISNMIVTSPGWNYTKAEARFYIGRTLLGTSVCELGPVESGGLTKKGSKTLILSATNTYAGATVVKAGTLKLGLAEALPSNTVVRVEGGTLDLNGFDVHVKSVSVAAGGTIANGSVTLPGITYDIADPQTVSCDCAVMFAPGAKITIQNVDQLDPNVKSYEIAWFSGEVTNLPTQVEGLTEDVLKDWHVTITPNRIRLSKNSGMLLMVR